MDAEEQDEELLGPPPREWPRLAKWHRPLIGLVGLAVTGAAVVAVVGSGQDSRHPSAARSTSPSPSSLPLRSIGPLRVPSPDLMPAEQAAPPLPPCPAARICETSAAIPDALFAALSERFPGVAYVSSRTLVLRRSEYVTELVARVMAIRAGAVELTIEVRRPLDDDAKFGLVDDDHTQILGFVRARPTGWAVTLRATAPSGTRIDLDTLVALANDRRLLVRPAAGRIESDDPGQR